MATISTQGIVRPKSIIVIGRVGPISSKEYYILEHVR